MARLVSKAEFARLAGVSRTAVSEACKRKLGRALVGKRLDLDHRAAQIYLAGREAAPTDDSEVDEDTSSDPTETRASGPDLDDDPGEFLELTLGAITEQFNGFKGFEDWLNARKKIADIREKDLKNEELEGLLIPREAVRIHVFGAIDAVFERLVRDIPRSSAAKAISATRSGSQPEEIERDIRDAIASVLKPLKQKISRALRDPGQGPVH